MAKTAAMAPAMGAQGTMRKKSKKMRLLRNPFSYTEAPASSSPSSFRNPFCDSFALIHTYGDARASETDGDEDGEEDEARIMHARRQALVALDPKNRDSWKAEFKSLKEYSLKKMGLEQQRRQELELLQQHQQQQSRKITIESSHEALEVLDEPPPDQSHEEEEEEEEEEEDQTVLSATPPPPPSLKCPQESSDDSYDPHNRDSRNSLFSTPRRSLKRPEADVPEISISLPTPPSSSTQNHPHEPTCAIVADPSLLSTTYTPSPLSSSSLDPLDASWQQNLSPEKAKAKERRTTVVYRSLLQRVSPSTPVIVRPIVLSAGSTADNNDVDALGAQIERGGTMTPKSLASSSWSLNRNTFGAFSKLDQRHHHHLDEQDQQQPIKQKFKQSSRLFRKQRSSRHALDPWDSSDDMLIQVTDDDDGNDSETPHSTGKESFLKGRVGVRRTSIGARTEADHVSRAKEEVSMGTEDWIVHPRTAAIKGTFHRVHEAVPVPSKDSRPSSLGPEFLTMSLSSPPRHAPKHQTFGDGAASLTRAQSTASPPVTPLRKGASAFLSGFGTASLKDSDGQAMMNRDMAESTQIRRMMNGQALPLAEGPSPKPRPSEGPSQPRSSMMTFPRMSTNSPPRITLSSSFASFRDLISSATGLVRSSSSVSENSAAATTTMFVPFSPATNLSRAQSTAYSGGGGAGRHSINGVHSSGTGSISFSPGSRRKTALVMMAPPTIVVAQKVVPSRAKDEEKRDLDASSMHTISSSSNTSASSSFTMLSSGLEQHQPRENRDNEKEEQEGTGLADQAKHPESKKPEFNQGLAAPSTPQSNTSSGQRPATTTPRHHSLLKVPEPAKAGSSSQHHHHYHHPLHPHQQYGPPNSVAASAMAAAQRAWLSSLGLTRGERELIRSTSTSSMAMASSMDSLTGPLTGDDYIGQFERERAKARGMMMMKTTSTTTTKSTGSLAAEAETSTTAESSSATLTTPSEASDHESHANKRGDWKKKEVGADETHRHGHGHKHGYLSHPRPRPPPIRRSHTSPKTHKNNNGHNDKSNNNNSSSSGIRSSFLQTIRIRRESSGPLDMSDRLMHLPEPSRFEGMCSCRGLINIASMLLILLGLVLLILGYPIATSLNKDRVAAEAAAGISATAPATAPGSDVLIASAFTSAAPAPAPAPATTAAPPAPAAPATTAAPESEAGPNPVAAEKRSILLGGVEGMVPTMMMDKRASRFAREDRSLNVVFSDEVHRKGRLA